MKSLNLKAVAGRRVLLRADLNVPLQDREVADATRVDRFAPTLRGLLDAGARVVVASHLGRPRARQDNAGLSLRPVAERLAETVGAPIRFVPDCVGDASRAATSELADGQCAMLENLRFHAGEEADDPEFAAGLARHADMYVNDAFSCSHRAHASIHAITRLLPAFAGPSLLAEVRALRGALEGRSGAAGAIVGGAKISSKIGILQHLAGRLDRLFIGGAMANTFLAAAGHPVGLSLQEPDGHGAARETVRRCRDLGCALHLPRDVIVAPRLAAGCRGERVGIDAVPGDRMILDVGPDTVAAYGEGLAQCRTLLWNGPLGAFEAPPFDAGTAALAREAARQAEECGLVTVAGGGDTAAALNRAGVTERFGYVSTAGGAFLEWIKGRTLPGIAALERPAASLG